MKSRLNRLIFPALPSGIFPPGHLLPSKTGFQPIASRYPDILATRLSVTKLLDTVIIILLPSIRKIKEAFLSYVRKA